MNKSFYLVISYLITFLVLLSVHSGVRDQTAESIRITLDRNQCSLRLSERYLQLQGFTFLMKQSRAIIRSKRNNYFVLFIFNKYCNDIGFI